MQHSSPTKADKPNVDRASGSDPLAVRNSLTKRAEPLDAGRWLAYFWQLSLRGATGSSRAYLA